MKGNVCELIFRIENQRRWLLGVTLGLNCEGLEKSGDE